jgi:predicted DNA-binding transcriptional regulator YafY
MTSTPAARLLALLELLQAAPSATAADLAGSLGVTERTVRRYVQRLVDLGLPVDSERGPYGGYRLRPRYRLPPLLLTPDEGVAVTLGLLVARPLGVGTAVPAASSALAKLQRVLPDASRERVRALGDALGFVLPTDPGHEVDTDLLTELATAASSGHRVRLVHTAPGGRRTTRAVDPYGVVFHRGRWYLVGYDHLRADLRTFRLDRIGSATLTDETFRPPDDFDPVTHLIQALAAVPYPWDVEVVLHTDLEEARRVVPPTIGTVDARGDEALLRVGADSPQWAAHYLVSLGVGFTVIRPDEVRQALRDLAAQITAAAERR